MPFLLGYTLFHYNTALMFGLLTHVYCLHAKILTHTEPVVIHCAIRFSKLKLQITYQLIY
jgi:hypothetical protein